MWQTFIEEMGAEAVVSETTNKQIISRGASRVVSETCLPVKVFIGHAASLAGRCDALLVPVVRSTGKKVYNCSRFLALPDLTRAVVPDAPTILEIEFAFNRGRSFLSRQI
jgi:predicted nucleotide-binding protein (sugar kinase/HSP70/actin superfamily)